MGEDPLIYRPTFFAFDTEPSIQADSFKNWVHILSKLAADSTIWTTWQVPGYPTTPVTTLASLYADLRVLNPSLPVNILDSTSGIIATQNGDSERNRITMRWYSEICLRAVDQVMLHTAYEPIWDAWKDPLTNAPLVRVGNYADFRTDGGTTLPNGSTIERTGWYMDRPAGNNSLEFPIDYLTSTANPPPPQPVPNDVFPRLNFSTNSEGAQLRFTGTNSRYLGVRS